MINYFFVAFLLLTFIFPFQYSFSSSNLTHELDSSIYGKSYKHWASEWWQWHISLPAEEHPRENYTPEACSLNQVGPVWFLADFPNKSPFYPSSEERECSIPPGKSVIIQIVGGECDYELYNNDDEVKSCVDNELIGTTVKASLNGDNLNVQDKRIGHYWFNITIPKDNIYDAKAGTFRALVDGYFLFLKPLPPGNYDLVVEGSTINDINPVHNIFGKYKLIIK